MARTWASAQWGQITDAPDPTALTVSVWVKPTAIDAGGILYRADSGFGNYSHELRLNADGKVTWLIFDGSTKVVTSTTALVAGRWWHLAGTATNSGLMRLWVHGIEEGTPLSIGTMWTGGDRWGWGWSPPGGYFEGAVAHLAIWSSVLPDEILAAMSRCGGAVTPDEYCDTPPHVYLPWHADEATGVATDYSGNGLTVSGTGPTAADDVGASSGPVGQLVTTADLLVVTLGAGEQRVTDVNALVITGTPIDARFTAVSLLVICETGQEVAPEVGSSFGPLIWAEFEDPNGTVAFAQVDLPDPEWYYTGYKAPKLVGTGTVRRALSDEQGEYQSQRFDVTIADFDRYFRGLLGARVQLLNRRLVVRMIDEPSWRERLTPRTVAIGLVRQYRTE